MDDKLFEAIKSFIETKTVDTESMKKYIVIFIVVNVVVFLANSIFQLLLKSKETKESIRILRNGRRLDHAEKIYRYISALLTELFDNDIYKKPKRDAYTEKVNKVRSWIDCNGLCINSEMQNKAIEIIDYITLVVSDPKKRDIVKENKLKTDYKKLYEAI